jgi:hypothetical protein
MVAPVSKITMVVNSFKPTCRRKIARSQPRIPSSGSPGVKRNGE